jgi:TonB family protein
MKILVATLLLFPMMAWAQTLPSESSAQAAAPIEASVKFGSPCPYPDTALRAGLNGATFVSYRVTPDGRVIEVTAIGGSHNADLDSAAQQCMSQWRVAPDDKEAAATIGTHRAKIVWSVPAPITADATVTRPAGHFSLGVPHDCTAWYPPEAVKKKISGSVMVQFAVTTEGAVKDPQVVRSSGNDDLDGAALSCVLTWQYIPAKQNDQPVAATLRAIVHFVTP